MKRSILILLILMVLPFKVGWGVDMYGTIETGVLFNPGSASHLSTMATGTQALVTDTVRNYRLSAFEAVNYITADSAIEAGSFGTQVEKYYNIGAFQLGVIPKVGMFTDISDGKNSYNPLLGGRFSVSIKDWIGISIGGEQIFGDDPMTNVVGGITLTPPVK